MKISNKWISGLCLIIFSLNFQSCATILGGRSNTLVFSGDSQPAAEVYINDTLVGQAPGVLKLEKKTIQHGSRLEIRAEGYQTQEYLILRKINPVYAVLDFFTAGTALAVDYATGNIFRPVPRKFTYKLEKTN